MTAEDAGEEDALAVFRAAADQMRRLFSDVAPLFGDWYRALNSEGISDFVIAPMMVQYQEHIFWPKEEV